MGLFDKLLKEGEKFVKEATSEENKEKVGAFFSNLKDTVSEKANELASEENKEKVGAFFSNLKDTVSEKAAELGSEENKEKVSSFFSNLKESIKAEADKEKKEEEIWTPEPAEEGLTCREKILDVLKEEFPQYEVRENVSPAEMGGTGIFMNYSLAVYENGAPKLVMMIIGKTTTAHREYKWSRAFAQGEGITFLNFVEHYPNNKSYISERLHKYL